MGCMYTQKADNFLGTYVRQLDRAPRKDPIENVQIDHSNPRDHEPGLDRMIHDELEAVANSC